MDERELTERIGDAIFAYYDGFGQHPGLTRAYGAAEAVIAAIPGLTVIDRDEQHVIEFRADGWTIQHPLTCRADGRSLFDCEVNRAAEQMNVRLVDLATAMGFGRFECSLQTRRSGRTIAVGLLLGRRVD
jgi:hypothetical protein